MGEQTVPWAVVLQILTWQIVFFSQLCPLPPPGTPSSLNSCSTVLEHSVKNQFPTSSFLSTSFIAQRDSFQGRVGVGFKDYQVTAYYKGPIGEVFREDDGEGESQQEVQIHRKGEIVCIFIKAISFIIGGQQAGDPRILEIVQIQKLQHQQNQ